eukprot:jgi/Undpi1/5937/HiC_scaffold_2.g01211.m1
MPPIVPVSVHWFRKGLHLHDNRALEEACNEADRRPLPSVRYRYAPCLKRIAGRIYQGAVADELRIYERVLRLDERTCRHEYMSLAAGEGIPPLCRGKPEEILPGLLEEWSVTKLTFEADSGSRSLQRDNKVREMAEARGIQVAVEGTSTMRNLERYRQLMGKKEGEYVKIYAPFIKLHENAGPVPPCGPDIPGDLPPPGVSPDDAAYDCFAILSLDELGVEPPAQARKVWISKFEKPKTSPNSIDPSTTVLSMEFSYFSGYTIPNFDKMVGNPVVRQIPWDKNEEKLTAWKEARTGFPFINAIMTQLKLEGWIHHPARHAVSCFLTRGDLWRSWEDGAAVFDDLLLDADWGINNFSSQWLSCSTFFHQSRSLWQEDRQGWRLHPPKYVPVLRHFPPKHIYEPWNAPLEVQRGCHCIIGKDYPKPIVGHTEVSKDNMCKMHDAYDANKQADASAAAGRGGDKDNNGVSAGRWQSSGDDGRMKQRATNSDMKHRFFEYGLRWKAKSIDCLT